MEGISILHRSGYGKISTRYLAHDEGHDTLVSSKVLTADAAKLVPHFDASAQGNSSRMSVIA